MSYQGKDPHQPLRGVHVVVVDDHEDSREILMHLLRYYGALVTAAASADEALELADTADVLLTDVRMPVRDGLWLLERVRQLPRRIPVVAVSAYSDLDAVALQRADFDRVLRKPVEMRALLEAITDLIRER